MAGLQCNIRVLSQNVKAHNYKDITMFQDFDCCDNWLCWWLSCSADDDDDDDDGDDDDNDNGNDDDDDDDDVATGCGWIAVPEPSGFPDCARN